MSRRLIGYPTGWTLAVLDDPAAADGLMRDLQADGVTADDLVVLRGPDASAGLDRLGSSAGFTAKLRRGLQFMTMDQAPDLHVYELAVAQDHAVMGLRIGEAEQRRRAVEVLRRHGAHFINRFGAWATEEIAPWRGRMPHLPQHMQR
jgi:hypothetical protein